MKTYQFKTNIKCGGCIAKVKPVLDSEEKISRWQVDLANPDKVLSVETEELSPEAIRQLVAQAGYQAESLKESWP